MAGILSALGTASVVIGAVMDSKSANPKELAGDVYKALNDKQAKLIKTDGSITKLLSKYIVEPILIVSKDTMHIEELDRMLETQVDIFSSYYMQAFQILSTTYGLSHGVVLDLLATDNGSLKRVLDRGLTVADKGLKNGFEDNTNYLDDLLATEEIKISTEAGSERTMVNRVTAAKDTEGTLRAMLTRSLEISIPIHTTKMGKHGAETVVDHTLMIPITVKAHVIFTDVGQILNMLNPSATDKSFGYRLDEYKSGGISLADLVFATDIIKEYKKNKINDKDQLLNVINERTLSANSKALDHKGVVGYEKYYNMLVVSANDKIRLDKHVNGDFFKEKYKQRLLEQARAMTVTIMDEDYERAVVLTKDIRGKSDISFKALSKRKDGKVDLNDMLKAMVSNKQPIL